MDQSKKARASDAGESPAVHCAVNASRIRSIARKASVPTLPSIGGNGAGWDWFVAGTSSLLIGDLPSVALHLCELLGSSLVDLRQWPEQETREQYGPRWSFSR